MRPVSRVPADVTVYRPRPGEAPGRRAMRRPGTRPSAGGVAIDDQPVATIGLEVVSAAADVLHADAPCAVVRVVAGFGLDLVVLRRGASRDAGHTAEAGGTEVPRLQPELVPPDVQPGGREVEPD